MRPAHCCLLLVACHTATANRQRPLVRRLREFNLGALARRLQAAVGGTRRRLTVNVGSCDCVQLSSGGVPLSAIMQNSTEPAGSLAQQILPGACLPGLQADCLAGGELAGAPECDLAVLDAEMRRLAVTRFFPSDAFVAWLVAASGQCQEVPVFTPESTRAVLQTPQQAVPILSPEAVALFLTIYGPQMGTPDDAHTTFLRAHVSGPQWAAFTESDYVDLGFSKGQVFTSHALFQAYQARFSEAGEFDPTLESGLRLGPVKVYPQVILERLIDVQAPSYFEIEYYVNLGWEDRRIFSRCDGLAADEIDETDPCFYYWKPELHLPDALLNDDAPAIVQDFGFTTHVGTEQDSEGVAGQNTFAGHQHSLAYLQYRQRAKFLVGLDYLLLPFDSHLLNFTMRFPSHDTASKACFAIGERNGTAVELPELQLGRGWEEGKAPAVWSGEAQQVRRSPRPANQLWDILDFTAHVSQSPKDRIFDLQSTDAPSNPVLVLSSLLLNEEPEFLQAYFESGNSKVCEVTFSIKIARRNMYHIVNYILMQLVLVALSWCTFFIHPDALDARLGIALTLLLAINVFQIVLVDKMPETGSLSRLQWFTILNTTLLALMAAESIIVCQCYQADMQRKMLDARLKQVRNNPTVNVATRKLQRPFRTVRLRRAQTPWAHRHTHPSRRATDGVAVVKIGGVSPRMDMADVATLVFSTTDRSSRWYRARKRWGRRRRRLVGAVAAYGDLVSATLAAGK